MAEDKKTPPAPPLPEAQRKTTTQPSSFPHAFNLYVAGGDLLTTNYHLGPDVKHPLYTISHIGGFGVNWMEMLWEGPDSSGKQLGGGEVKSIIGSGKYQLTLARPTPGAPEPEQMLQRSKGLLSTTYAFTHRVGGATETFEWRRAKGIAVQGGGTAKGWTLVRVAQRASGDKGVVATCVPTPTGASKRAEFRLLGGAELDDGWATLTVMSMMKVLHDNGMKRTAVQDLRDLSKQAQAMNQAHADAAANGESYS